MEQELLKQSLSDIQQAEDLQVLDSIRVRLLGKQGSVSLMLKELGKLDPEQRKTRGQELNQLRMQITDAIDQRKTSLEDILLQQRLETERVDVTLPARPRDTGHVHPISQVLFEVLDIFKEMGFAVAEGPNIEDDYHNFTALNIPAEHPARQEMDTFYLPDREDGSKMVLRTHTSPVQIRTMAKTKPPIRIVAPGRTYRSDSDPTHTPTFHQIEGLIIEEGIHMGHLKQCLIEFCERFFEVDELPVRFRPGFFPFTEPSAEVDIACKRTGQSVKIGDGDEWLEILGCGMVHPNVLKDAGLDPAIYQGFAFGMGIERIAMLKYGIPDLRAFYEGDIRWIEHFGFPAFQALMSNQ
ncbi:MAG: phenylalanine--tRNA ligase subunit alpha [Alphaproteobacteria bacterium]